MKKISFHHSLMLYFIFIATSSVSVLPFAVTESAGKAGIISIFCALPAAVVLLAVMSFIYKKNLSINEFLSENFGKKFAKIYSLIIILELSFYVIMLLKSFGSRTELTLSYVGRSISIIALMSLAFFAVSCGFKAIIRTSAICFALLFVSVFLIFLFCVKGLDFTLALPFTAPDFSSILKSLIFPIGSFCFLVPMLFFYKPDFKGKGTFFAVFLSLVFMSAVSLIIISTFSLEGARKISFPFFSLINSADTFSESEHFEAFFTANWLIFSAAVLCFVFYSACEGLRQTFSIEKKNDFLKISALLGVVLCALSLADFLDSEKIIYFNSFILPYFNIISALIIPLFLVIFSKMKQKVHKNVTIS